MATRRIIQKNTEPAEDRQLTYTLMFRYPDRVVFRLDGLNMSSYMSIKRVLGLEFKIKHREIDVRIGLYSD